MDELRLKNAIRCQAGCGKKYCKQCPYCDNGECDTKKISSDAIFYIKDLEQLLQTLQDIKGCDNIEEPTISWDEMIHPDIEAMAKRDAFLSDENGKILDDQLNRRRINT